MPAQSLLTLLVALVLASGWAPAAGALAVAGTSPARHSMSAAPDTVILVDFDRPVDPATLTASSLRGFGRSSGPIRRRWPD